MSASEWREISVLGRTYHVSDAGLVANADGSLKAITPQANGYGIVNFTGAGRSRKAIRLHVLVARAFIGPRPAGQVVRHLDGNYANSSHRNLAYGTPLDNANDARLHGKVARGARNGQSKLTEQTVRAVRRLRGLVPQGVLATWLGVSQDVISKAQRGATWAEVTGDLEADAALRAIFSRQKPARCAEVYADFQSGRDQPGRNK